MKNIIELNAIKKVYKMGNEKIIALNNINLSFEENKIYCILGTSGSGKSTLLNLIAGLEKPTSGQILFKNMHIENFNEEQLAEFRKKYVGFVFQSYNLIPHQTILQNVELALAIGGLSKEERIAKAKTALDEVGLEGQYNKKPNQLGLEFSQACGKINLSCKSTKALYNLSKLCLLFSTKEGTFFICATPTAACISVTFRL